MNYNSFGRAGRNSSRGNGRGGRRGGHRGGRDGRQHVSYGASNNRNNDKKYQRYDHIIEESGEPSSSSFTIAVQGCSHGELDSIYDALKEYGDRVWKADDAVNKSVQIDVLLCCGDVQTLRNEDDYHALAVPPKYRALGDFYRYYSGLKLAPYLTIMIGGNHESSNYLQELYYGGWVAPNIYYLGAAGVVNLCKLAPGGTSVFVLRIAGLSGIFKSQHYKLGRYEMPPYSQSDLRSVYHTRRIEVERLRALSCSGSASKIDIMLSHDWPRGIAHHGNSAQLIQRKPFFRDEIHSNTLGSPASESLLNSLKPRYWFAAHLHVKFEAIVRHKGTEAGSNNDPGPSLSSSKQNESTLFAGLESNEGFCPNSNENTDSLTDQMTRFLSLDKCLPKRRHLQILHIQPSSIRKVSDNETVSTFVGGEGIATTSSESGRVWLEYDPMWLAIHLRTEEWTQPTHGVVDIRENILSQNPITDEELHRMETACIANPFTKDRLQHILPNEKKSHCRMPIPINFVPTVTPHCDKTSLHRIPPGGPSPMVGNPQTDQFLDMLGICHRITVASHRTPLEMPESVGHDDNEIQIDNADEYGINESSGEAKTADDDRDTVKRNASKSMNAVVDPGEISLEDDNNAIDNADEYGINESSGEAKTADYDRDSFKSNASKSMKAVVDPGEINLEDFSDEAGDTICFAPKRPRV